MAITITISTNKQIKTTDGGSIEPPPPASRRDSQTPITATDAELQREFRHHYETITGAMFEQLRILNTRSPLPPPPTNGTPKTTTNTPTAPPTPKTNGTPAPGQAQAATNGKTNGAAPCPQAGASRHQRSPPLNGSPWTRPSRPNSSQTPTTSTKSSPTTNPRTTTTGTTRPAPAENFSDGLARNRAVPSKNSPQSACTSGTRRSSSNGAPSEVAEESLPHLPTHQPRLTTPISNPNAHRVSYGTRWRESCAPMPRAKRHQPPTNETYPRPARALDGLVQHRALRAAPFRPS